MRFILTVGLLASAITAARAEDPAERKAWAQKCAGLWVLTEVESEGASTAGDKSATDALKQYPTALKLSKDGEYSRRHSNFYAVETEEGTFSVVKVGGAAAEVDVSGTLKISGDGPKRPDTTFKAKEIWQLKDADTLQRCYAADPAKGRPTDFKTAKGDGLIVLTYTRLKAAEGEKK
jgi:hypothetical protein